MFTYLALRLGAENPELSFLVLSLHLDVVLVDRVTSKVVAFPVRLLTKISMFVDSIC
jgi:hypothetical protein